MAALAAVVALVVMLGDDSTGDVDVDGNTQGDGGCIVVGDGNTCGHGDGPRPTAESLKVSTSWPQFPDCDGATEVVVLAGGIRPSAVRDNPEVDLRETLTKRGAASFGLGHLYITLQAVDQATIQILGIRPIFYPTKPATAAWVYAPEGECGGADLERVLELNLDHRQMKDLGIVSESDEGGKPSPGTPTAPFGNQFKVTPKSPSVVRVDARACDSYREWGLQITYAAGGQTYKKVIGSKSAPFRSVGRLTKPTQAFTFEGSDRTGQPGRTEDLQVPWACR